MPKKKKSTKTKKSTSTAGAYNLVIVESPTKTQSISRYLGSEYEVVSSKGHIIDLPKSDLGIDVDNKYTPQYEPMHGKKAVISDLKKAAKKAKVIYLATDLDREGEAISWHVVAALDGLDKDGRVADPDKFKRVIFPEITKNAVAEAFEHPRDLDYHLIDAYQARRVLDRLVGYKLSPLLWKKIQYGLSAGRVQSVAVRIIVEREKERKEFQSAPYYKVLARLFEDEEANPSLEKIDGADVSRKKTIKLFTGPYTYSDTVIDTPKARDTLLQDLDTAKHLVVVDVTGKEQTRKPNPPFTTASLQRASQTYLHTSAKNTMRMAQRLYEEGYITYHRTDATNLSNDFLTAARAYIQSEYGSKYLPSEARYYKGGKNAQEAHEAIRPTNVENMQEIVKTVQRELGDKESRLYKLIWQRAVASQASDALYRNDTIVMKPKEKTSKEYTFLARGSVILFDGHLKIYGKRGEDVILPDLEKGQSLPVTEYYSSEHFTSPPPRYSEASLIKELETHSIGRPSTYAPTIDTIQNRGYVIKENNAFVPEDAGTVVTHLLVDHFPQIVDLDFTAGMENNLDEVAEGKEDWVKVMDQFYKPFDKDLVSKEDSISREDYKVIEHLEEKCPDCGKNLQLKLGRYGKFYSCSNFPECKYARPFVETIGMKCPTCTEGDIIVRRTRRGKKFFGCSKYPNCDWASWNDPRITKDPSDPPEEGNQKRYSKTKKY